jgi:hypothetical protein
VVRGHQPGDAAADDEKIGLEDVHAVGVEEKSGCALHKRGRTR